MARLYSILDWLAISASAKTRAAQGALGGSSAAELVTILTYRLLEGLSKRRTHASELAVSRGHII